MENSTKNGVQSVVIGVDNGNANTKTGSLVFPTGIVKHDSRPPMTPGLLKFEGKYYTLSNSRKTYLRDKTEDDDTFILTLYAIAKELKHRKLDYQGLKIHLGVGLPPGHFNSQREKFKQYFLSHGKNISFELDDELFSFEIADVYVLPQTLAAAIVSQDIDNDFRQVYVVDIGGYTVDAIAIVDNKPDYDKRITLNKGIITMSNKIASRVSDTVGRDIEEIHITDYLRGKPTMLDDESKRLIDEEAVGHAEELINDLAENGIDLSLNPSLFVGGGSLLLKESLQTSDKVGKASFTQDISVNAKGYEALINQVLINSKKS